MTDPTPTERFEPPAPPAPPAEPAPPSPAQPAPPAAEPAPSPAAASWPEAPSPAASPAATGSTTWESTPPAWSPGPVAIVERRGPGTADIIFGLLFLAVGLWLFADVALDLDLPRVRWGELWPLLLIGLGGWVLLGAARRR